MIPTFPQFIDFYDVPPEEYVSEVKMFEAYSDFNYVSIYAWSKPGECHIAKINNNLVLSMNEYVGDKKILSFIGTSDLVNSAHQLLKYINEQEQYIPELQMVPKLVADEIRNSGTLQIVEDHNNHDYVLSTSEALTLFGRRYLRKRQHLNKFRSLYGDEAIIRSLDLKSEQDRIIFMELNDKWTLMGTDGSRDAENERRAINKIIKDYEKLRLITKLHCTGLFVREKLVAFIIYEIGSDYSVDHFAKSDLSYHYAGEYLLNELMKHIYTEYGVDEINIEQDLGISGLREHKMGHSPTKFFQKYTVKLA